MVVLLSNGSNTYTTTSNGTLTFRINGGHDGNMTGASSIIRIEITNIVDENGNELEFE